MCNAVLKNHPWLSVDSWESSSAKFAPFEAIIEHTFNTVAEEFADVAIHLFGADLETM
jgi:hypothetical protein